MNKLIEITEESYEENHKDIPKVEQKVTQNQTINEPQVPLSFLLSGNDLKLPTGLICKHPTIDDILEIDKENNGYNSEQIYFGYVSLFTADPYDYMVFLDDNGMDYEKVSPFQLFIMLMEKHFKEINLHTRNLLAMGYSHNTIQILLSENIYYSAFRFFFDIDFFVLANDVDGNIVITDENGTLLMDDNTFNTVHQFLKAINGIEIPKDRIYPENNTVKQMLIEDMREDAEQKQLMKKLGSTDDSESSSILGKYLSAITWIGGNGITAYNRNGLHIYDVIDGYKRISKKIEYDNTILGIYTRCINGKSVNFKERHWAS